MELKSYKGHTLLHLMYHFTHLSASSVIPPQKQKLSSKVYSRFGYLYMDLLKNLSQTTVVNLPARISWMCVKLLGLL